MNNLLVIAVAGLIWFVIGVIVSAYVKTAVAVATTYVKTVVAEVRKKTQSVSYTVVDAASYALPDTSIYNLTVAADSAEYAAGMYLLRDNGKWSSVYLTQHARALMGDSADVVALSPARVVDAAGTSHVWHVAIA